MVHKGMSAQQARKDHQVHPDHLALLDLKVPLVQQDQLAHKENLDYPVLRVHQEVKVKKERQDHLAHQYVINHFVESYEVMCCCHF